MALLIPVALDKDGVIVLPSCAKDHGPFKCIECSDKMVVRQGDKRRWHFAHLGTDASGCSAGGESMRQLAAKLIVAKYITKINFVHSCPSGQHRHFRYYERYTSPQEFRYDGQNSADVPVVEDGNLRAIVEVKLCHATTGRALESRISLVGVENLWVVDATKVLESQCELHHSKSKIKLHAETSTGCRPCAVALKRKRDAEKDMRDAERARREVERASQPPGAHITPPQKNVVEIIDSMTLRRNGVLMKKNYVQTSDGGGEQTPLHLGQSGRLGS